MTKRSGPMKISVPGDVKILYSDSAIVHSNKFGLILDFAQQVGPGQQMVVSRIGMSREHARALLEVLARHLDRKQKTAKKSIVN